MKVILKILLFLLTVAILSQCKKDKEPNIVTIPDNNFLNALIELGVDTNGDGIISPAEAEVITFLDVSSDSISNLTEIEKFVNMDTLWCYNNHISNLDVSNSTTLEVLYCHMNQLTTLDISNNTELRHLSLMYMPSLYKVCVWEMPFPPSEVYVDTTGSPNVYFTTYCD